MPYLNHIPTADKPLHDLTQHQPDRMDELEREIERINENLTIVMMKHGKGLK